MIDPAAVTFAVTFCALYTGHQFGDHISQTDWMSAHKHNDHEDGRRVPAAVRSKAMAAHLATYHLTLAAFVVVLALVVGVPLTPLGVAAGLAYSAVTHGLIDLRWPVRWLLNATGSPRFAEAKVGVCGMYAADQTLHIACLAVSAVLMARL